MLLWTIPSIMKSAIFLSFKELLLHQQKLAFDCGLLVFISYYDYMSCVVFC